MITISILAGSGFFLSLYAYLLERKVKINPNYKPLCDISDRISCTKPILSKYAHLFYFSNAAIGMFYYALVLMLAFLHAYKLLFVATLGACAASLFLGYLLYFKIKSLCIVCTVLYIINFGLLALALYTMGK